MESVLKPPASFCFAGDSSDVSSGNISDGWIKWKKSYDIYCKACEINKKSAEIQFNILLHVIGDQCREILDQLQDKQTTVEGVLKKLDEHFKLKKNVTVERHKFFTRDQKGNETIEQYIFELRKLSQTCEFGSLREELIKDRLVCGIGSSALRERLLREEDLDLNKASQICHAAIASRVQSQNIKREHDSNVYNVVGNAREEDDQEVWVVRQRAATSASSRGRGGGARPSGWRGGRGGWDRRGAGASGWRTASSAPPLPPPPAAPPRVWKQRFAAGVRQCGYCGTVHKRNECPAYGKKCMACSKMNHFAKVCGSIHYIEESDEQVIYSINKSQDWSADLKINNNMVTFKLDTGADVNVLPLYLLPKLGISESDLIKTNTKLNGYSGAKISVVGKINLRVFFKTKLYVLEFKIADVKSVPILGRFACTELDVVRRVLSLQETINYSEVPSFVEGFDDVFSGIGCLPKKYSIKLKNDVVPVVHAPRKLPFAIRDDVKRKLDEMESQNIIAKVQGPSDWVSSITVVKKPNGELRICLDPKELNEAIKREHFRLPTLDEIVSKLAGAKYFSTLDASSGFWNVPLDETSAYCTFNTPFGRYKFLRMPYGICSASEVFHKRMYEYFDDIEGVCMYIDDLLIYAKDREEHNKILKKVLERCREINLKLNKGKCKFLLQEIKYLGHIISKNGLSPDKSHISAITNMPTPQNKKDVERLLGLITYVGTFIPNLSEKTSVLRELLRKETEWHWDRTHEKSFEDIKSCLTNSPVLQYYNFNIPITISVDASKSGLGACLMQNGLPVCYASRSLNKAEQRYAQIEKELYACVFACERFYAYIYGRTDITIETDHKPLISIIKKPIVDAPARLQRMLLRLQKYTFKLVYKPGKHLYIADTLSRAYEPASVTHSSTDSMHDEVCAITRRSPALLASNLTDLQFIRLQKQTEIDSELLKLKKYIARGWPDHKNETSTEVTQYWNYKEDLTVAYGLVWKGERLVIPKLMRKEFLQKIHIGHMGLEKCKLRARETIFWPGLNNELQNYISNCNICLTHRKSNQKEELQLHDIPDRPWAKVAVDLFQLKDEQYLLLVDYYSKFFELVKLRSTTSEAVITSLKDIFSRQGIPNTIMSDCGPQFSSSSFKQFASEWNFVHITSSPHYPQSNGQIERTVQTVKRIMIKTSEDRSDYRLGLLEYLNTPISDNLPSPSELLQSRKLRSILPTKDNQLKPKVRKNVKQLMLDRQLQQKQYYDRNARNLERLDVGQNVRVLDLVKKKWISGTIIKTLENRSYEVKLLSGRKIVRNRRHIIKDSINRPQESIYDHCQYDDITCSQTMHSADRDHSPPTDNNNYVTRSGRTVRQPTRWANYAT